MIHDSDVSTKMTAPYEREVPVLRSRPHPFFKTTSIAAEIMCIHRQMNKNRIITIARRMEGCKIEQLVYQIR